VKSLGVFVATTIGAYLGTVLAWATYAYLFHIYDGELDRIASHVAPICSLVFGLLATGISSLHTKLAAESGRRQNRNER
jgi:hypothetical protein